MTKNGKCALCGSKYSFMVYETSDLRLKLSDETFRLICCNECGLNHTDPMLPAAESAAFYPKDARSDQSMAWTLFSSVLNHKKYRKIVGNSKAGKILDIGCGNGSLLSLFKRENWVVHGVEISKTRFESAKKELPLESIYNCTVEEAKFESNYFDVVVLNHVLEHIADPNDSLKEINRVLKPSGLLYLSVPNISSLQFKVAKEDWYHLDIPRHIFHYNPETITKILEKNGFQTTKVSFPFLDFPLDFAYSLASKPASGSFSRVFSLLSLFPLAFISVMIQLFPAWRGTLELTAKKH
jgi:2-polyprenyl-3-methyl-5-hydroxy-6-metoxy-1,4-benzoquinol methylase